MIACLQFGLKAFAPPGSGEGMGGEGKGIVDGGWWMVEKPRVGRTVFDCMISTETTISIFVNGDALAVAADASVAGLLREIGLDPGNPRGIAVAVNDEVVRKGEWQTTILREGDRVEVITAQQGG